MGTYLSHLYFFVIGNICTCFYLTSLLKSARFAPNIFLSNERNIHIPGMIFQNESSLYLLFYLDIHYIYVSLSLLDLQQTFSNQIRIFIFLSFFKIKVLFLFFFILIFVCYL